MDNCVKGFVTNDWDRDNLMFLIHSSKEVLKDWYKQADADDLAYAKELLEAYKEELIYEANNINLEKKLSKLNEYTDALKVIEKCK